MGYREGMRVGVSCAEEQETSAGEAVKLFNILEEDGWITAVQPRRVYLQMLQLEHDQIITRVIRPEKLSEFQAREILSASPDRREPVVKEIAKQIEVEGKVPSAREIHKIVKPEQPAKPAVVPASVYKKVDTPTWFSDRCKKDASTPPKCYAFFLGEEAAT